MPTVNLSGWQTEVWEDEHRFKIINAGRRSGKTVLSVVKMIEFASSVSGSTIWYISPTYKQSESIAWALLKQYMPSAAKPDYNEQKLRAKIVNGSTILLKGADNPDTLRGVGLDLVIFDECAFMTRWDEVWKVIRPTLMDSQADIWFISTPNGFNHFKTLADTNKPDWQYFHFTTYDNPHIAREEIEQIKLDMDPDSFAQEMMGEFRKMSGLIYKMFSRQTHMVDVPHHKFDSNWIYTRSLDFGFSHKTALGYFAINPNGTEIYMYDGLYQSGMVTDELAEAIRIKDAGRNMVRPVADSASPLQIEELSRKGIHFEPAEKGQDSVQAGITKVAELLKIRKDTGKPTLMFDKNLTWIADEFEGYRWMENKTDGYIKNVPLKRNDDGLDMTRYFAMTYNHREERLPPNYFDQPTDSDLGF